MAAIAVDASYESPTFETKSLSLHKLTLSVADRLIAYCIHSPSNDVVFFKKYRNTREQPIDPFLDAVCFEDEMLKNAFGATEIVFHSAKWLLVPNLFLPNGSEETALSLAFDLNAEEETVLRDFFRPLALNVVYTAGTDLLKKCKYYFHDFVSRHAVTQTLQLDHKFLPLLNAPLAAHIELFEQKFIYTVFQNGALLFCNQYAYHSPEDVLYYLLSVNETLGRASAIAPQQMVYLLTGAAPNKTECAELLEKFLPAFTDARALFPKQTALNKAGLFHEEYPYLMVKS